MKIVYTEEETGKEIFTCLSGENIIPRKDEKIFFDDELFLVLQVYHWIDTKKPDMYIEISLKKL